MNKEFLTYEESIALKQLGFDELCLGYYNHKEVLLLATPSLDRTYLPFYYKNSKIRGLANIFSSKKTEDKFVSTPTYQQAFRWFRENYSLQHEITRQGIRYWLLTIYDIDKTTPNGVFNGKKYQLDEELTNEPTTYEKAELECLKKLIELVKSKT